jgi:hypothetical protein
MVTISRPRWQTKSDLKLARDIRDRFAGELEPGEQVWVAFRARLRSPLLSLAVSYLVIIVPYTALVWVLHYDAWLHSRFPTSWGASESLFSLTMILVLWSAIFMGAALSRPRLVALTDRRMLFFRTTLFLQRAKEPDIALSRIDLKAVRLSRMRVEIRSDDEYRVTLRLLEKDANATESWFVPSPPANALPPSS